MKYKSIIIVVKGGLEMSDAIFDLIKANRPEKLTKDTDYLNTIPKGEMIKAFLEKITDNKKADIKMLALYGAWGSGKTSLLDWIKDNLDKERFVPVFFEAWQHEHDNNIELSLVDAIALNINKKISDEVKEIAKEVWKATVVLLKGAIKSTTITANVIPGLLSANGNGEKFINEIENYLKESPDLNFYEKKENFKKAYEKLENRILGENKQLIVFIDDLDRCEVDNILNLLSMIKLFFIYGKRTIYICAIDKEAVNKAVFHKYNDIIKADEYLEKIFDISFSMPSPNVEKMVSEYFPKNDVVFIREFFESIDFINPRHMKKVLNKYLVIKYLKENNLDLENYIPDLNIIFYKILVLYMIVLYEFNKEDYDIIKNWEKKIIKFYDKLYDGDQKCSFKSRINDINKSINGLLNGVDSSNISSRYIFINKLVDIFAPQCEGRYDGFKVDDFSRNEEVAYRAAMQAYIEKFDDRKKLTGFCNFLLQNNHQLFFQSDFSKCFQEESNKIDKDGCFSCDCYKIKNIFSMVELYL